MPAVPLIPAKFTLRDDLPYSEVYGDVYHSRDGGLQQAEHVFLAGNELPARWGNKRDFVILETGFGLGLNFLSTWRTWDTDAKACARLHYIAIEKHPFSSADLAALHGLWPELGSYAAALHAAWPPLVSGFHRVLLQGGRIVLTLIFGEVEAALRQVDAAVDAFYLDGFAPSKNPEMWSEAVLRRLSRLAAREATLATYSVSAAVRRTLTAFGFICEKKAGFGHKREMLSARYMPRWPVPIRRQPERKAVVIGAGIAGSAVCERLTARGWDVLLVERHLQPAQEASGNIAGIVMPVVSRDDNQHTRLLRAAYLFTLHWYQSLGGIGKAFRGDACGVLQLARDAQQAQIQREIAAFFKFPPEYARWLEPEAVQQHSNINTSFGGWLFPSAGWIQPASLCEALLARCGDRLHRRFGRDAGQVVWQDGEWSVLDKAGMCIAAAPVVIFAAGTQVQRFEHTRSLPIFSTRGQVSHVPAQAMPNLRSVICADGYATPPVDGICSIGASYDLLDEELGLRVTSHVENLERFAQIFPNLSHCSPALPLAGRVGFRSVVPDRLPLIGALPNLSDPAPVRGSRLRDVQRAPGLHAVLGFGSRGLTWAGLAAELLAAHLENEPLPVEAELAAALDPARFLLKSHRRSGAA